MKEDVNELSVCLYSLNRDSHNLESTLSKHFHISKIKTVKNVASLLKRRHIFCIVITANIGEDEEILEIRKICSAFPKIPCIAYGHLDDQKVAFVIGQAG